MELSNLTDKQLDTIYWRIRDRLERQRDLPITKTWTLRRGEDRVALEQCRRLKLRGL